MSRELAVGGRRVQFGGPWLAMCFGMALHTWDEAAHDFLAYYNATVLTLHGHFPWIPRMDWEFRSWLGTLIFINLVLFALTPFAYRNARWLRGVAYVVAGIQFMNGMVHIAATLRGYTVPSVRFDGPAPGVYSAPVLLVLAAYLFWSLRRSRKSMDRGSSPLQG